MDELFEVLTLVQTGKKRRLPIILMGRKYWDDVINFANMVKWGYIAKDDLKLFHYAETGCEAWHIISEFYKKHTLHSPNHLPLNLRHFYQTLLYPAEPQRVQSAHLFPAHKITFQ